MRRRWAREVGELADESKPSQTRRAASSAISKAPVGSTATLELTVTVEPTATKAAKPTIRC
jgi:hypothetical protein